MIRFFFLVNCTVINVCGFIVATESPKDTSVTALQVLQKTKTPTTEYALYIWNRVTLPKQPPVEEWSAEFHSGDLHRVETPRDRVVANCRLLTGASLNLVTGAVSEGAQVANAACGINTNGSNVTFEWLGPVHSMFGRAERIRLTDPSYIRVYDVSDAGVLLRTTYSENREGGSFLLTASAVGVEKVLPSMDMFDRSSLVKSYVPDRYKRQP